ncbi:MAG: hypothetical protein ACRBM6_10135 [Geminicoccales bacterium]
MLSKAQKPPGMIWYARVISKERIGRWQDEEAKHDQRSWQPVQAIGEAIPFGRCTLECELGGELLEGGEVLFTEIEPLDMLPFRLLFGIGLEDLHKFLGRPKKTVQHPEDVHTTMPWMARSNSVILFILPFKKTLCDGSRSTMSWWNMRRSSVRTATSQTLIASSATAA